MTASIRQVAGILLLLVTPRLVAQPGAPAEPPTILSQGAGRLVIGSGEVVLPVTVTPLGPLFGLPTMVANLGGELQRLPKGRGHILQLAGKEYILGPDSPVVVVDGELTEISQRPLLGPGGVEVPLDLLERTFGDELGYGFEWDSPSRSLAVNRQRARTIPISVDAVNLASMATVVLQFPERPRYRVVERDGGVDIEFLGDRVLLTGDPPSTDSPLVRGLEVRPDRVSIDLASTAAADHYELSRPTRLVFDIHPGSNPRSELSGGATPALPRPQPPRPRSGLRTIVIDPGHGGGETGAVGPEGTLEKDLTLLLAKTLKRRLEQRLPVRVILSRTDDSAIPLDTRTALANQNKGDLFISLHLNASFGNRAAGAETYFLSSEASDERAAAAAERENQASAGTTSNPDTDPLYDLQLILFDLAQTRYLAESQRLAKLIQEELNGALGLRDRGVKQAPFQVLMGAAMPAVLVEFGFISNPQEEQRLADPAYRAQLVEAVVRAVSRYRAQSLGLDATPPEAPASDGVIE